MNSDVHPAVAALILAATFLAIALWMWASGVAASYGGPAELVQSPNGRTYVQIQNYLVEHDTDGAYLETYDLTEMNVEPFLGGFAFFSNGDVLLRRGPDPRGFLDNLRAYKRETNRNSVVPESSDSGLFRCKLDTFDCDRFGKEGVDFKAAFGVFIDPQTDEVYVSDTTRHLLRKYSAEGVELAPPVGGFKFPNQLTLHDGTLLVADTNHHVVRRLAPDNSNFADSIDRKDVVPPAARLSDQTWPSHFARVDEEWWVNNMRTGMNRGGIYVFDDEWQYSRRVELPADADPIALLAIGDAVWVSDWNNDVVRRFTIAGAPMEPLESAGLEHILASSREQRFRYTIVSYAGFAVVALMFLGLIVRAFAAGMNKGSMRRSAQPDPDELNEHAEALHLEPDEKVRKRMARAVMLLLVLSLATLVPLAYLYGDQDNPEIAIRLLISMVGAAAIMMLIAWTNRSNWGTSIRVEGQTVTLRDHTGRQSSCAIRDVRYDDTAIATRDVVVILGRPNSRIYEQKDVQERLMPRLGEAQRVGPMEMLKIQVSLWHPQGVFAVIAAIGLLVYAAVTMAI